jgi:asparagine synthase (glutamine-hydrolysing)
MRYVEPGLPINTFSYIARGSPASEESWVDRVNQHVVRDAAQSGGERC